MDRTDSIAALFSNREQMYLFLARLYRVEVDQTLLDQMAQMDFSIESDQPGITEGYRMIGSFLARRSPDMLTDLAVDYASVFIGAGKTEGNAAYPYESVYTSPDRLIMQEARDQVLKAYRAEGLDRSDTFDDPEDHIALEFEYMAHLCQKTHAALLEEAGPAAADYLAKQKNFLERHLLNWIPSFCADVVRIAETEFYQGAARITRGYLEMEQPLIEQLLLESPTFVA